MDAIEKLQATRSLIVMLFDELARTTPEGVVLTKVSMGDTTTAVQIDGFSDTTARVAEYLRNINKSALFDNAEIIGQGILASDAKAGGKQGQSKSGFDAKYAFSIKATITPPATNIEAESSSEQSKP
jgi:Tfp pilus assembly protein PilN